MGGHPAENACPQRLGFPVVTVIRSSFEADLPPQRRIAVHRLGWPSQMGAMRDSTTLPPSRPKRVVRPIADICRDFRTSRQRLYANVLKLQISTLSAVRAEVTLLPSYLCRPSMARHGTRSIRVPSALQLGETGPAGDLVSLSRCPHLLSRRERAEVKRRVLLDAVAARQLRDIPAAAQRLDQRGTRD